MYTSVKMILVIVYEFVLVQVCLFFCLFTVVFVVVVVVVSNIRCLLVCCKRGAFYCQCICFTF